jgi:hypothetical protein
VRPLLVERGAPQLGHAAALLESILKKFSGDSKGHFYPTILYGDDSCQSGADKQFVQVTTAWGYDDCIVASWSKNFPPTCVDRERLCKSACREYLRLPAKFDCLRSYQSEVSRLLIGAFAARARFGGIHKIKTVSNRPSGSRTRKLFPSVHSSNSDTQPSKCPNGLEGGAFCAIAAALRQTSTIKRGKIDL